ncbi:NAD(P)H-dependent oxidoreductase [Psychroserpens jangbogonensis]|uniref:NAD(P)H-dependent oxidoreductase n=1 Tax=Psychroserpens jangbogonensis TaxID=1484460 RepID=UPI00053F1EA1|nr:NAD(P)H-dependent oxidoreductase [Psychroserpens jangbogonensis]
MKNILIINAHQKWDGMSEGKLNERFQNEITTFFKDKDFVVRTTKIEDGYDINDEVNKHDWADLIITQTPVFWFNTPWIHKKYIDEVFTSALQQKKIVLTDGRLIEDRTKQYGTGGISQGKKYMMSTTWNAPEEAFDNSAQVLFQGKSADEALINLSVNYKFCGFEILAGFHSYNVIKEPQIEKDIVRLTNRLNELTRY